MIKGIEEFRDEWDNPDLREEINIRILYPLQEFEDWLKSEINRCSMNHEYQAVHELAERQALGARYHAQQRINEIDGLIRGYRATVNLIIKEEKALLKEKKSLQEVEGLGK